MAAQPNATVASNALTMSEDTSLQHLPANVDGLGAGGGLPLGQHPVHKVLADEALLEGGEVVLSVLDQVGAISLHPVWWEGKGKVFPPLRLN